MRIRIKKIMNRLFNLFSCVVAFAGLALSAQATINVQYYWRMGENDGSATNGMVVRGTGDVINELDLAAQGSPIYSSNVAPAAAVDANSSLCVQLANQQYLVGAAIGGLTNNFGIECWVKPTSTNSGAIVYDGDTGGNGWGLFQNGTNLSGLFGHVAFFGQAPLPINAWTYVAMVCNDGITTVYTNGAVAFMNNTNAPLNPAGNFLVGADNYGDENFSGLIDELRLFTFPAGLFHTNDLLINSQLPLVGTHLGATRLLEGPAAGIDSVVLGLTSTDQPWTAAANTNWLHIVTASGVGSTNVIFTFDANIGGTRAGTLTIAGQMVTITQAAVNFAAATLTTNLPLSGLGAPAELAADAAGNIYLADSRNDAIKEWIPGSNSLITLVSEGLVVPEGVTVDQYGNVFIADSFHSLLKVWDPVSGEVSTLGGYYQHLYEPVSVAADVFGNVFIAETGNGYAVAEWIASSNNLITAIDSGLNSVGNLAVDAAGNLYTTDPSGWTLQKWNPASQAVSILANASSGLLGPFGVAVDGGGNVYVTRNNNSGSAGLQVWSAISNSLTTLVSNTIVSPSGVAVDGGRNVYIADSDFNKIYECPHAFVNTTPRFESILAGTDGLPTVLPADATLTGGFQPVSDSSWLTINPATNGATTFSFTANPGSTNRVAHINVLGVSVTIIQTLVTPPLVTASLNAQGDFILTFTNNPTGQFYVTASTNLALPLASWRVAGNATNVGGTLFQFAAPATNSQHFYRVVSPPAG